MTVPGNLRGTADDVRTRQNKDLAAIVTKVTGIGKALLLLAI
jgi:hypothetical protein